MNILFDIQPICVPRQRCRGIPFYAMNLLGKISSNKEYACTGLLFDYGSERGNRRFAEENLSDSVKNGLVLEERNDISYRDIMKDILDGTRSFDRYYEDLSASKADVTHFLTGQMIPNNVRGPAVVTVHDIMSLVPLAQSFVYDENAPYLEASLSYLKERPDIMIISDSASTKADLVNYMGINDERIKVVPLSCDKTQLYPERDSEILREMKIQEPYILFLAAFVKHKGIVDILKAFSAVKEKHKEIKLVLAGNINFVDDDVKKAIERHPNREDIVLPGFVSEQQKRVLMSMAEVFVFPSYYEGFGFPVLEAMSCGCPVITTNVSSLPEVGGDAALYCERGDVDTLSELMQYVLDSSTIREKLCRKSLQQADKFSWDNTALETERVYKKIVKG